ncbi:MAG: hypothetical protein HY649_09925 [Acidobacteria bacterium]|nr:hypothetical protein [Acidobacteriota bacterium]
MAFFIGMAEQVAEKLPDDVIPKSGAFCRAEESAFVGNVGNGRADSSLRSE